MMLLTSFVRLKTSCYETGEFSKTIQLFNTKRSGTLITLQSIGDRKAFLAKEKRNNDID